MKIKLNKNLKKEILITLKNGFFKYSRKSLVCKIFNIDIQFIEVFKSPKQKELNRESKVELLQWLKLGYINTENSAFSKLLTPPTFLEIMIAATSRDKKD